MQAKGVSIIPKPITKAASRRLELRDQLWPGKGSELWHRTTEDGYSSVPRTLPLLSTLLDHFNKGKDTSRVYVDLWCRQMDDSFVEVTDEESFAFSCGYTVAGRNVRTWRERVDILRKLGFIDVRPNGSRKYGFILLNHPHTVVKQLHGRSQVPENWWSAFAKRASEVGARL